LGQIALLLLEFILLLAKANIGFLQGRPRAVNLGQRVLDGPDGRDSCYVQRHAHELAVRLVEIAGVAHDSRHTILNVF